MGHWIKVLETKPDHLRFRINVTGKDRITGGCSLTYTPHTHLDRKSMNTKKILSH